MDPLSLLVGAMAGACFAVVIMSLMGAAGDDDEPPVERQFSDEGPLILPDDRRLH